MSRARDCENVYNSPYQSHTFPNKKLRGPKLNGLAPDVKRQDECKKQSATKRLPVALIP